MRGCLWLLPLALVLSPGCRTRPDPAAAVRDGVRLFMETVARDVTAHGPTAWRRHFADTPSFFMVSDGQMVFADSRSASEGIRALPQIIRQIELNWGGNVRVDPLTPTLASVATPYSEVLTDPQGHRTAASGFFTGLAEYRNGQWQFRNAHWSTAAK